MSAKLLGSSDTWHAGFARRTTVGCATLCAIVSATTLATADDGVRDAQMASAMRSYFAGELAEGAAFIGIGAGTAYVASSLAGGGDFGIGLASAMLPVSAIQIGAGLVLWVRTEGQVASLLALHARDPAAYRKEELPRMERVNYLFDVYKVIEVGLITLGGASIAFGVADHREGFVGAGVGLATQGGAMLTFDLLAEDRAQVYTSRIRRLTPSIEPVASPKGLGFRGFF